MRTDCRYIGSYNVNCLNIIILAEICIKIYFKKFFFKNFFQKIVEKIFFQKKSFSKI